MAAPGATVASLAGTEHGMIITGASLLGQILTNRTSSGLPSGRTGPAPPEAAPPAGPAAASPPAAVTLSLSTFDALFALRADPPARTAAPSSGTDPGPPRTTARTAVDPSLVRAITAALDGRTGDGASPAATGQRATVSLETSISRRNSLCDALELAGRARSSDAASGRAAFQ